ncbi:MAG TPA: hypothetical protein VNH38_02060 [Candidatus Dormibacteraeota bacterium]|nr:hypothetical protein [Candidatus Dormibacteraeota bacterium]
MFTDWRERSLLGTTIRHSFQRAVDSRQVLLLFEDGPHCPQRLEP